MKNWIKKQFADANWERVAKIMQWAVLVMVLLLGAVNIYQGFVFDPLYFMAGIWQIMYGMIYWFLIMTQDMHWKSRKMYREIIDKQFDLLNQQDDLLKNIRNAVEEAEKEKKPEPSKQSGFTLIELLVVIAIIGILGAVMLASFSSCKEEGKCGSEKVEQQIRN